MTLMERLLIIIMIVKVIAENRKIKVKKIAKE